MRKQNEGGPLANALLLKLSDLVSSNQTKELAMVLPFLPLLKMHVLAQSEEDIRNSLQSVREFIDDILDGGVKHRFDEFRTDTVNE